MNDVILTERAENGASDISGVKNAATPIPEAESNCVSHAADEMKNTDACAEIEVTGELEAENATPENGEKGVGGSLESEFEELVKGRFSEVYKRKVEGIIRRRLRSSRANAEQKNVPEIASAGEMKPAQKEGAEALQDSAPDKLGSVADYEAVRRQNQSRPIENGLSGSSGIVTRINVSALDSEGVLSIIRRVGSGEKISFK